MSAYGRPRPSSAAFASHRRTTSYATTTNLDTGFASTTAELGPGSAATTTTTVAASMASSKARQYAHLNSQLAQLHARLADTENLMRMTAAQAGDMRFLGGYVGALFMGAAKVLGEEGVRADNDDHDRGNGKGGEGIKREEGEGPPRT